MRVDCQQPPPEALRWTASASPSGNPGHPLEVLKGDQAAEDGFCQGLATRQWPTVATHQHKRNGLSTTIIDRDTHLIAMFRGLGVHEASSHIAVRDGMDAVADGPIGLASWP